MEVRIAMPSAVGLAIALGMGLSALVPTRMVSAGPPPWANAGSAQVTFDSDETERFSVSLPQDLDPSLPVGPQTWHDDDKAESLASRILPPRKLRTEPVYVAVSYGIGDEPAEPAPADTPLPPESAPLPPEMEATSY